MKHYLQRPRDLSIRNKRRPIVFASLTMESMGQAEPHPQDGHRALAEQHLLVDLARPEQAVLSPVVVAVPD